MKHDDDYRIFSQDDLENVSCFMSDSLLTGRRYKTLILPYAPSTYGLEEPAEMKIEPSEFKYDGYFNRYNSCDFSGPDPSKEPTKRKFYNCSEWYRNYYDGKYGQTNDVEILKEVDISAPIWQNLVIAMAVSGDYTLQQALYIVAMACDRCRHALLYEYRELHNSNEGYSVKSDEYQKSSCRCQFCYGY